MHTQEPWQWGFNPAGFFSNEIVIRPVGEFPHGDWIADVGSSGDEMRLANARRIVACVNACAGIPTEVLENGHVQIALGDNETRTRRDTDAAR